MKKIGMLAVFLLLTNVVLSQNSKIVVEADKNLKADFNNYKTYQFAPQVLDDRHLVFFVNDLILKENIIHSVEHELQARGYESTAARPDMIINFRVIDKPTQLTGFTDPQNSYWGGKPVREPDDKRTYDVKAGTLMISMVDRKSGELIWQGFASGILDNNVFDKKKERVEEAVSLLFDKFKQRADNLTRK